MVGSGLTLVVFTGAGFLLGNARAMQAMSVRRVEPTQLATAMAGAHFFSDYRTSTLLVRGRVDAAGSSSPPAPTTGCSAP